MRWRTGPSPIGCTSWRESVREGEGSGLRHNDKGKRDNPVDEAKIAHVTGDDRRSDLATGEGNQAVVRQPKTASKIVPMALLEGSQDGARSPEGVRGQRAF